MSDDDAKGPFVVHVDDAPEEEHLEGEHWGHAWRVLTPNRLGVNLTRLPPGRVAVPSHTHERADEVFYVLAGRGVLRYGERLRELRAGDRVSCPAATGVAHQIANPFDEDLVYLAIGVNDAHEVCTYPDTGKVLIRSLRRIGTIDDTPYMAGEPELPKALALWAAAKK